MRKFLLAQFVLAAFVFLVAGLTPAYGQLCGFSPDPTNTCTGSFSGINVTTGTRNTFYGRSTGQNEVGGSSNSYFGAQAGFKAVGAQRNSFFGASAGPSATGSSNAFFGTQSGGNTTAGAFNAFFGDYSGFNNTTGSYNTSLGRGSGPSSGTLSFSTAVGAGASVTASNTIQLGRSAFDTVRIGKAGDPVVATIGPGTSNLLCISAMNVISLCNLGGPIAPPADKEGLLKTQVEDQQKMIDAQNRLLREQQGQIEALKNTICEMNSRASICRQ